MPDINTRTKSLKYDPDKTEIPLREGTFLLIKSLLDSK